MSEDQFSIDEFRSWLEGEEVRSRSQPPTKRFVGLEVEPRVPHRRIVSRMDPEGGDRRRLASEFCEGGGRVVEVDGPYFLVEVGSGSFVIPKNCVRRRNEPPYVS